MDKTETVLKTGLTCYHCGSSCKDASIHTEEKIFCCHGCQTVFEILSSNQLCSYYDFEKQPGSKAEKANDGIFQYLDNHDIQTQLIDFTDGRITKVTFFVPTIHCSSCIWLLENLYKLDAAIFESRVDFLKKQVFVTFEQDKTSLRKVAELLASIGYEPLISLNDVIKENNSKTNHLLVKKIAVAGFCAGNIMMFSFPDYFGLDSFSKGFGHLFIYLNLLLSLPVLFYSGSVYFESVFKSLKKGVLNIDAPILLGILATFGRSLYEVASGTGTGYFDSMSGLIFFLLIGKWFTDKTYNYLSFERDYKSYFPLAVNVLQQGDEKPVTADKLRIGDKILVRNNELIPADALLYKGTGNIDYSFVTGESAPVTKQSGDLVYAGGRQKGGAIELEVVKETSQSYLTRLWNNPVFEKENTGKNYKAFSNTVARYFTVCILALAFSVAVYWCFVDSSKAGNAFTAILIIACPCTLALSYPIALGNVLRRFGKNKFYLKNTEVIENLANTDTIVFDKTGTITDPGIIKVAFKGAELRNLEKSVIASLTKMSGHPLSRQIHRLLEQEEYLEVSGYKELAGEGIAGHVSDIEVKIGSELFVTGQKTSSSTRVYVSFNQRALGYFEFQNAYKPFINQLLTDLKLSHSIYLLSGDNNAEQENLTPFFGNSEHLRFNQSPQDKLDFVKCLQSEGLKVAMIGDGLNDAGALKQAYVGIAVTHDITNFTPASDAIIEVNEMRYLPQFIRRAKTGINAVKCSFVVSLVYNFVGLTFAVRGDLQPVVAAVLMPLSSVSVVLVAMVGSSRKGKQSA